MTPTPNVEHRFEVELVVPGTPDDVWQAIATADGNTAWLLPTELEERLGGAVVFHMGPGEASRGTVTGWDPPRRLVYEEDWATLVGHGGAPVTPLVTEFIVEARSGGTCAVRVVSSAFGTGADWENEFFADVERGWVPALGNLRLYLEHFRGQRATTLAAAAEVPGTPPEAIAAVQRELAADAVGAGVEACGLTGVVEQLGDSHLVVRATAPVPGLLSFFAYLARDGVSGVRLDGHLFSDDASAYAERGQSAWTAWLQNVGSRA